MRIRKLNKRQLIAINALGAKQRFDEMMLHFRAYLIAGAEDSPLGKNLELKNQPEPSGNRWESVCLVPANPAPDYVDNRSTNKKKREAKRFIKALQEYEQVRNGAIGV